MKETYRSSAWRGALSNSAWSIAGFAVCVAIAGCKGNSNSAEDEADPTIHYTAPRPAFAPATAPAPETRPAVVKVAKEEPKPTTMPADGNTKVTLDGNVMASDIKVGTGPAVKDGDSVTVNYIGWLTNGVKFDSSMNPGRSPFQLKVGQHQVIPGWETGLIGMKMGGIRKLTIPPAMGYGDSDHGSIPGGSTLIFEIHLLSIN
jgi:FKBP-type peptidyl-prolyl cis-trans isomerase